MRKFISLLFLVTATMGTHAQEITSQENQAKEDSIFNVKISEEAHYAEVTIDYITKDDKDVNAQEMDARRLLQAHIIEIFSKRFNMNNEDVQEIWDVIDDKCQNVEIKRGDLFSVFSYITKDAFKGLFGRKKLKPLTEQDSLILFGPKEKVALPKAEPLVAAKTEPETVAEKEQTVEEVKEAVEVKAEVAEVKVAVAEKAEVAEAVIEKAEVKAEKVVEEVKTVVEEIKAEVKPEVKAQVTEQPEVIVPDLCQTMIAKENFQALMGFLDQEKTYGKLFFGGINNMQNLEKCYVVILDKNTGKIVGVLDKGKGNRMNFMTRQQDRHDNYTREGYRKIFVQEIKK